MDYIDHSMQEAADLALRRARSSRDARRAAVREAVKLLGPATELHRTTIETIGEEKPAGFVGVVNGTTKPGDRHVVDSLHYTDDVIAIAAYITDGER